MAETAKSEYMERKLELEEITGLVKRLAPREKEIFYFMLKGAAMVSTVAENAKEATV